MKCQIIGVLDNGIQGLTPDVVNTIQSANLVIGATRTLQLFSASIKQAEKKRFNGAFKRCAWVDCYCFANGAESCGSGYR